MYEKGKGVDQSYEKAVKWYQKAADQGNYAAKDRLADLIPLGIPLFWLKKIIK
jgi:TPR repeat protein